MKVDVAQWIGAKLGYSPIETQMWYGIIGGTFAILAFVVAVFLSSSWFSKLLWLSVAIALWSMFSLHILFYGGLYTIGQVALHKSQPSEGQAYWREKSAQWVRKIMPVQLYNYKHYKQPVIFVLNCMPNQVLQDALLTSLMQSSTRWVCSNMTPTDKSTMWGRLMGLMNTLPVPLSLSMEQQQQQQQQQQQHTKNENDKRWWMEGHETLQQKTNLAFAMEMDDNNYDQDKQEKESVEKAVMRLSYETQTPIVPILMELDRSMAASSGLITPQTAINIHFLPMMTPPMLAKAKRLTNEPLGIRIQDDDEKDEQEKEKEKENDDIVMSNKNKHVQQSMWTEEVRQVLQNKQDLLKQDKKRIATQERLTALL